VTTPEHDVDPERSLGYQVRRCHRRFDRLLNAHLSRHGLKTGFWYYLRVLWIQDGVTQKYLSDMTNVAENTTASLITNMMQQDLVVRHREAEDKRKFSVTLTPKGKKLEHELMHYASDINRVARSGIAPEEIEVCLSVLQRMSENLRIEWENLPDKEDT